LLSKSCFLSFASSSSISCLNGRNHAITNKGAFARNGRNCTIGCAGLAVLNPQTFRSSLGGQVSWK
jgi:hypothetical protein